MLNGQRAAIVHGKGASTSFPEVMARNHTQLVVLMKGDRTQAELTGL